MSRPTTKADLIRAATENCEKLERIIENMTEEERNKPFDFSEDEKKKEAHWKRDKNLRDILIHLYGWHELLLKWVAANRNGEERPFLPEPYNWKTYGEMNVELWRNHQGISEEDALKMFQQSHREVLKLAEEFDNDELFTKGAYPWTGGSTLGSYFVSVTSSHYDWAMKKLKAHAKKIKNAGK